MTTVHTGKLLEKLVKVVDFRVGEGASKVNPLVLQGNNSCPATDGTQIFMPTREKHFKSEADNEFQIADSTAHESDHIREVNAYFAEEVGGLRERGMNLVKEYCQRNYSELKENPALAGWIDNIVKDRRIDAERREQLPGVKKFDEEVFFPAAEYFRPSTRLMSELDAFREQYLQKALIGRVLESIPEKHRALLEEVVRITNTADSIYQDPEIVKQIYNKLKENFDITQPISRSPPMPGRGNHSQPSSGSPQQGYGKDVEPREGRNPNDKKPERLEDNNGKDYSPGKNDKDKKEDKAGKESKEKKEKPEQGEDKEEKDDDSNNEPNEDKNSQGDYRKTGEKYGMSVDVIEPEFRSALVKVEESLREKYAGEIESMKRIFRQLQVRHYGERRDLRGQELDYQEYMQSELEGKVTGIRSVGKYFKEDFKNVQKPSFGIHADISGSTAGRVIESIKAAFYIMGNALSASDWNYGLYASDDSLAVLKDPTKKWDDNINYSILGLGSGGGGIYLEATSSILSADLRRTRGNPKCLVVISDFEVCGDAEKEKAIARRLYNQKIYPFYIAIGDEHGENAKAMTSGIGEEHYSVIPLNKLHELPEEIFRLFKTFGVAR